MKILVLSDSHNSFSSILRAMENERNIDMIIHAGDVHRDVEDIMIMWPNIPCAYVLGNNDFFVHDAPNQRFFEVCGKKIFLTHGHLYGVKSSTARVEYEARKLGADICIFGHTHTRHLEEKDGLWILNPGAASRSYGIIQIKNGVTEIKIKDN